MKLIKIDNLNKITIKKSFNIYKKQNRISYGCKFIIEKIKINVFNNIKEDDYNNKITIVPKL